MTNHELLGVFFLLPWADLTRAQSLLVAANSLLAATNVIFLFWSTFTAFNGNDWLDEPPSPSHGAQIQANLGTAPLRLTFASFTASYLLVPLPHVLHRPVYCFLHGRLWPGKHPRRPRTKVRKDLRDPAHTSPCAWSPWNVTKVAHCSERRSFCWIVQPRLLRAPGWWARPAQVGALTQGEVRRS